MGEFCYAMRKYYPCLVTNCKNVKGFVNASRKGRTVYDKEGTEHDRRRTYEVNEYMRTAQYNIGESGCIMLLRL